MRDKLDLQIMYLATIATLMALSPLYKQTMQKPLSGIGIIASDCLSTIS